jgi:CRP-like cAMP-binding protein
MPSEILYGQNEKSESFALITEGEFDILFSDGTHTNLVATLSSGQPVGDVSLFDDNATRSATVKASKMATVYEISIERFKNLMLVAPKLRQVMFNHLVQKVYNGQRRLRKLGIQYTGDHNSPLKEISAEQARRLGMKFSLPKAKTKNKNKVLANAEVLAEKLYCVEEGEVILLDEGGKEIARLGPGSYCDEVAFYADTGRHPYSVVAQIGSKYSYITRKRFFRFTDNEPGILWPLANTLSKMLKEINTCLTKTDAYKLQAAIEEGTLENVTKIASDAAMDLNSHCPIENDMPKGTRFIHAATRYNRDKIVGYLISQGAKVDEKDEQGNSAAHIAALYNHLEVLQILYQHKAKMSEENNFHETPLKIAYDHGHTRIIDFLTSHGSTLDELSSPHN